MWDSIRVLLVAAGLVAAHAWVFEARAQMLGLSMDRCETDDELSEKDRAPYEQTALRFTQDLVKGDILSAHAQLAAEIKKTTPPERLAATIKPLSQTFQKLGALRIAHTYSLTSSGTKADHTVFCSAVARGPSSTLEDKVFVFAKPLPRQAHVILEGQAPSNIFSFVLWLIPEKAEWHVYAFHVLPTTILKKSAVDMLVLAREQRRLGHDFNAAVLFAGASDISYRGPNLQLGIWQVIQKEAKELPTPRELQGQRPFTWQLGADSFRILGVGPIGVGGKLVLLVRRETPSLDDRKRVDDENHLLIREFTKEHREYAEVFDAILVEAVEAGSTRIFRTVEEVHKSP
jgi:hypothetical protein